MDNEHLKTTTGESENSVDDIEVNATLGRSTIEAVAADAESDKSGEEELSFEEREKKVDAKIRTEVTSFVRGEIVKHDRGSLEGAMNDDDLCHRVVDNLQDIKEDITTVENLRDRLETVVRCAKRARRIYDVEKAIAYSRLGEFDADKATETAMNAYDSMLDGGRDPMQRPFGGDSDWMLYRRQQNIPDSYESDDYQLYHPDPDFHGDGLSESDEDFNLMRGYKNLEIRTYAHHYYRPGWTEENPISYATSYMYRPQLARQGEYRPANYDIYRPADSSYNYRPVSYSYRPVSYNYRPSTNSSYRPSDY